MDSLFWSSNLGGNPLFSVRGIVDKINETTNDKVIPTRLQNVMLGSSNSPNETVRYKLNF